LKCHCISSKKIADGRARKKWFPAFRPRVPACGSPFNDFRNEYKGLVSRRQTKSSRRTGNSKLRRRSQENRKR
jgi:hypothetical protein